MPQVNEMCWSIYSWQIMLFMVFFYVSYSFLVTVSLVNSRKLNILFMNLFY